MQLCRAFKWGYCVFIIFLLVTSFRPTSEAQPVIGTTTFDGSNINIAPFGALPRSGTVNGWSIFINGSGSGSINHNGANSPSNVNTFVQTTSTINIGSDDGSEFNFENFRAQFFSFAGTYTITAYKDGASIGSTTATASSSYTTVDLSANTDFDNIDEIRLSGFGGSNVTLNIDEISISAAVSPNNAPTISLQDTESSTNSTTAITFNAGNSNLISIADVDGDAQSVTIAVTGGGTFSLSGTSGLSVSGNGTSNVTLSGSLANVNTALNGASFNPAANVGQHVISISTNDGTDSDGPDDITIGVYPASTTLTTESFESFTNLDTDFTNSATNQTFSFTASTFTVTEFAGFGIGGSDLLIDNVNNCNSSGNLTASFLIDNSQEFYVKSFWLFPSENCAINGTGGSVTIRGKNNNGTQFTKTILSGELNNDQGTNEGFTFIPMDAFAGYTIDELEFETAGSISYVGIDDLEFAAAVYSPVTAPTVATSAATSVTDTEATLNGNVTSDGGASVTERGFVYALTANDATPTVAEVNGTTVFKQTVSGATGTFNVTLSGLTASSGYSYVAYATNSEGTTEGSVQTFTTNAPALDPLQSLYWPNYSNDKIEGISVSGTHQQDVVSVAASGELIAIDIDIVNEKVYWFDQNDSKIYRANLDGTGTEVFVAAPGFASTIFVDHVNGYLYWPNNNDYKIERIKLDGTGREDVISATNPIALSVDLGNSKVYWFDQTNLKIYRGNLDGTGTEEFVSDPGYASTFYIDQINDYLYWPRDDGSNDKIERIKLDGTGREDVVTATDPIGINVDVNNSKVYWYDLTNDKIYRSNLDGTGTEVFISSPGYASTLSIPWELPANSAPSFNSSATVSFAENTATSTVVLDVNADDGDGGANDAGITYSLASGGDNDLFNINSGNGQITFKASPDYETSTDANSDNAYEITVTADDGEASNNTTDQSITITVTDVDEIAPSFENGRPATANVGGTSFNLNIDIDEAGTVYYVVVADGDTAPTSAEVKAGTASGGGAVAASGSQVLNSGGFTHSFSVTGLTSETAYDVYVVAEDDEGTPNLQASPAKLDVNTSDITAPSFENGRPSTANITGTSFNLHNDIDEAGTVYYVVVADGATAPTSAEVKAGTASGGGSAVTSDNQALNSGGFTHSFNVTGLNSATAYDIYVVAEDDEGTPNIQASPTKLDVSTIAVPGLTIVESSAATATAESGSTDDFTVVLDAQPASDVVVNVGVGDATEGSVDKTSLTFTNGNWDTPQTVTVTGVDDDIIDGTISYNITFSIDDASSDDDYDGLADKTVSVDNSDDDVAGFTIVESSGSSATAESGTTDDFTVVLNAEPSTGVVIDISSGDTGEGTVDKASLTFTSANWDTPQTVTVTGVDDDIIDSAISYNITLSIDDASSDDDFDGVSNQVVGVDNSDDDVAGFTVTESSGSTATSETGTTDDFTVVLDAEPSSDVVIDISSGDTGEGTVDKSNLTFTSGNWDTPQTVTVTGVDDALLDGNISYNVTVAVNAASSDDDFDGVSGQTVSVTNQDDDQREISVSDDSVAEGDATATLQFTVSLNYAGSGTIEVNYATSDGSAKAGSDYTSASGTLTFNAGETSKTVGVTVSGDAMVENDETITLTLSGITGDAIMDDAIGTGTITNDDQATVTIADVSTDENDGKSTVTLSVDNAVDGGFTVDVSTADGSAKVADSDYTAISSQTLTFTGTASETQTFDITLGSDSKVEADETLTVSMSGLSAATVASGDIDITDGATVTITNDDAAAVTVADVSGNEDDGAITVTATLDNAVQGGFTVDASTSGGTATAGTDYTPVSSETLTFTGTAGETQTFTVTPTPDTDPENNETINIALSNLISGLAVDITDEAVVTIDDDDASQVSVSDASMAEGETGTTNLDFTISLDKAGPAAITVDYATADNTAEAGSDYTATSGTVTFAAGETSKTVSVAVAGEKVLETDETFTLNLSDVTGMATLADASATGTITNDDAATVTIADISGNEDDGSITVTATLDFAVQDGFSVDVSTTDGSATTGDSDYTAVSSQTLTFTGTAGEAQAFAITLGTDSKLETDETLTVSMSNLVPTTVASGDIDITDGATVTITNDDAAAVTVADVSGNEDDGAITVTATLDKPVDGGFSIDISIVDGTATAGTDYTALSSQTLSFAGTAGEKKTFTVSSITDTETENDETISVSQSNLTGTSLSIDISDEATVTITNDDNTPVITASQSFTILEETTNGTSVGTVEASDADAGAVLQDWMINGGNTDADSDSNPAFAINSSTGETTVNDADDLIGGTSFALELTVSDGVNTSASETVTINIGEVNDAPSFTKGADQTVLEDAGTQTIDNWATDISAGPADESGQSVTFSVSNDNNALFSSQPAIAPNGTLTYTPAANAFGTATVTVSLSDNGGTANGGGDTSDEVTFNITVTTVNDEPSFTAGSNLAIPAGAGTHQQSGWASNISSGSANESSQQLTFDVGNDNNAFFTTQPAINSNGDLSFTLAEGVSGQVNVTVSLSDDGGTANGGDDTSDEVTFTINIGKLPQTITFDAISDKMVGQDPVVLTATGGDSGLPITYSITTDPASGVATLEDNTIAIENVGTVTVTASQAGNALYEAADNVSQTFSISANELFLPTLFTPNGDGNNDRFILRGGGGIAQIEFSILDRDNNLVYHTSSWKELTEQGWDGIHNGKVQPLGTYVWVINGKYTNGLPLLINGKNTGIIRLLR